jgi:START domain
MASSSSRCCQVDLQRMREWPWKERKRRGDDVVYEYEEAGEPLLWLKVEAIVNAPLASLQNLLDTNLLQRQSEWHKLFIEGRVDVIDDNMQLCWMAYKSGSWLVDSRDFVYEKHARFVDNNTSSLVLSYRCVAGQEERMRSIDFDFGERKHYVRGFFEAAHHVEAIDERSTRYVYIQRADPRGLVPVWLTRAPQTDILLDEVVGVRKAVQANE